MIIRKEQPVDVEKIRQLNLRAFETGLEAKLVDTLRQSGIPLISLVAEEKGKLIGHILFSPVSIDENISTPAIAGLAPMAVLPNWQKRGVGSRLVEEGLRHCKNYGYAAVVVLGHSDYYPRFGFVPSVRYGIKSEYDVPDNVFMIKELENDSLNSLKGLSGIIRYHHAFKDI
ncbi:MAG: N-acetyltransferase [Deltaproteobacteria bacterium]|nr:MAG: N-acetyltransferase [Deltaproteobacteria bacterium]